MLSLVINRTTLPPSSISAVNIVTKMKSTPETFYTE